MTPFEIWLEAWVNKPKDISDRERWIAECAFMAGSIVSVPRRKAVEHTLAEGRAICPVYGADIPDDGSCFYCETNPNPPAAKA